MPTHPSPAASIASRPSPYGRLVPSPTSSPRGLGRKSRRRPGSSCSRPAPAPPHPGRGDVHADDASSGAVASSASQPHRCSRCPYVCESAYLLVCHEQRVHVAPDDPDNAAPPGEGWSRAASGDWIWSTGTGTPATQPPPRPPPQKDTAAQVMLNRQQKHQDDALQASMARAQEFNNALNMEESAAAEMACPPRVGRRWGVVSRPLTVVLTVVSLWHGTRAAY